MTTIASLLRTKGRDTWHVAPDSTVYDAIKLMADRGIGALLVMDGGKLVGIVSERDYARKVALMDRSSRDTPVRDIMTDRVVYVHPQQSVEQCMALMTNKRIRHLPVMKGDDVVGIVSIGDLVKSLIADRDHLIEQLENYITGR